jgi:hypothetical protein
MIGLTIGTGEWKGVAERAAAQMQAMTGIECFVIDQVDKRLVHPSWHKLNLIGGYPGNTYLIFDADIWCCKRWNPQDFEFRGLAMVAELDNPTVFRERQLYGIPQGKYYNAGLIICDSRCRELFAQTMKLHPRYGNWLEQTGLNRTILDLKQPITELPLTYNHLVDINHDAATLKALHSVNLHFAGRKTVQQLHAVYDQLQGTTA